MAEDLSTLVAPFLAKETAKDERHSLIDVYGGGQYRVFFRAESVVDAFGGEVSETAAALPGSSCRLASRQ